MIPAFSWQSLALLLRSLAIAVLSQSREPENTGKIMPDRFDPVHARLYDQLHREKDHAWECELVRSLLVKYADIAPKSLLILGCRTGTHAIGFSKRGYEVVGIDDSHPLLTQATTKAQQASIDPLPTFQLTNLSSLDLAREFDAAIMLSGELGYQTSNEAVRVAIETVRRHLRLGGLFLFECWYGPAVLSIKPTQRLRVIDTPYGEIVRAAAGSLNVRAHTCDIRYDIWEITQGRPGDKTRETHTVRYFFPMEIEQYLQLGGFTLVHMNAFPEIEHEPDETTWNLVCVARAT